MNAMLRPANQELFARRYFLVTDATGYETLKTSQEALDAFTALYADKYPSHLPLTVVEMEPKSCTSE